MKRSLYAELTRAYEPDGLLKTETQRLKPWPLTSTGGSYTAAAYETAFRYDRDRRLIAVRYPNLLADSAKYAYGPVSGRLTSVTDPLGRTVFFGYDANGRLKVKSYPGGVADTVTYDLDGRVLVRRLQRAGTPLVKDSLVYDRRERVLNAFLLADAASAQMAYTGLGQLRWMDQSANGAAPERKERFLADGLGTIWRDSTWVNEVTLPINRVTVRSNSGGGRLAASDEIWKQEFPTSPPGGWTGLTTSRTYDDAGNLLDEIRTTEVWDAQFANHTADDRQHSRSYWSSDDQLRVHQVGRDTRTLPNGIVQDRWGAWEEHRYDALGRRVMKIRRQDDPAICDVAGRCETATERFFWAGERMLWEARAIGVQFDVGVPSNAPATGQIGYAHAGVTGGIDAPVITFRTNGTSLFVHPNWRGLPALATDQTGADCSEVGGSCEAIRLPGDEAAAFTGTDFREVSPWHGSLAADQRDASGFHYRRNRYYDPASGQFTQADPIGVAGRLNLYGFADGDPVNFSDPLGLCPDCVFDALSLLADVNDIRRNGLGVGNGLALAADVAALAIPGVPALGAAARAARARRLGAEGEAAVRAVFDIGKKASITLRNGRTRIPDGQLGNVLTEVKNVRSLSFTRQLRDFADFAQDEGLRFDLFIRSDTKLSGPLSRAVDEGLIKLRRIPGRE